MAFLMNPLRLNSQAWAAGRILKLSIPMSSINLNYHNYCNNQHSSPSYFSLSTFRLNGSLILKQKNRFEKLRENSRHNWCSKKSTVFHISLTVYTQYNTRHVLVVWKKQTLFFEEIVSLITLRWWRILDWPSF